MHAGLINGYGKLRRCTVQTAAMAALTSKAVEFATNRPPGESAFTFYYLLKIHSLSRTFDAVVTLSVGQSGNGAISAFLQYRIKYVSDKK